MVDVEEVKDLLAEAGNNKGLLKPHVPTLLELFVSKEALADPVVYKVMAAVVALIKDGLLESDGEMLFACIDEMLMMSDLAAKNNETALKRTLDEVANALFSNSCSILQSRNTLLSEFLPQILQVMTRDENARWAGYACVAPLLHVNVKAFANAVEPLLQVMQHFPGEVLSVVSELYEMQPKVFEDNISLLIQLYQNSPAAQLSILHILHEIGQHDTAVVEPHLLQLKQMCEEQSSDPSVNEIKEFFDEKLQLQSESEFTESENASAIETPRVEEEVRNEAPSDGNRKSTEAPLQGTLRKRGRMFGRLVPRWFTLEEGSINFFKNSKKSAPSRRLSLTDVVKVVADTRHPHAFTVQTRTRSVVFSADSDKEKEQWISAIEKNMKK